MADGNITRLPVAFRLRDAAEITGHPMSNVGSYRYSVPDADLVDIAEDEGSYVVWLNGYEIAPFATLTNASRAAERLRLAVASLSRNTPPEAA